MALLTKRETAEVVARLAQRYPDAKCALNFTTPFELLIATMLSAQCTDARVNMVTARLFQKYQGPRAFATATPEQMAEDIREVGLFRTKAQNIVATARILLEKYGGEVPKNREQLVELPGVGRKTANVVLSNAFGIPAFAVDTHVQRVTNRIGIVKSDDPLKTEEQACRKLPRELWTQAHHLFIHHGRQICVARKPKCDICPVSDLCHYVRAQVRLAAGNKRRKAAP
ncbi:endonuclease III [Alicyclobacillus hesperidum subsp. aegles]|uniref:endonuclease III n=1 Tax=Alicyclobacillus hesperidum TaxID=89784 RepID=UPI00222DC73A|nr:endonuclease III [Alicyclobacillus hesperidum]GLG01327.1 endonuclease III [Alicyclobacillus hesperidum subsp. aegles]